MVFGWNDMIQEFIFFFISVTVKWSYKIYTLCLLKVVTESMFSYANPVIKLYSAFVSSGESCEND